MRVLSICVGNGHKQVQPEAVSALLEARTRSRAHLPGRPGGDRHAGLGDRLSGLQGPQRPAEAAGSGRALFMARVSRAGPAVQVGTQTPKPGVIESKV